MYFSAKDKQAIDDAYLRKKEKYARLMYQIDDGIQSLLPTVQRSVGEELPYAMKFIFAHLPVSDLAEDTIFTTVLDYAETALYAKEMMPWGRDIPVDIFLADVLFPRVNNEWLEPVRRLFYDMLAKRVQHKTMKEAIIETNYFCFEQATYVGADIRTAPPSTLLKSAQGRCGEESVFAIMALRSIGIPARQIYVPRWAHCDSNHAWVEVWCDEQWHYLGACEPEEELDRGWFTSASSRALLVESKSFCYNKLAAEREEAVKNGIIYNINRTSHYAPADKLVLRVVNQDGQPVKGLRVILEIIDAAGFSPIGELITDERGETEITIGRGTVHLHVTDGTCHAEQWIDTGKITAGKIAGNTAVESIEVVWDSEKFSRTDRSGNRVSWSEPQDMIVDFDTVAPVVTGATNRTLDEETTRKQKINTEIALNIRKNKEAGFYGGGLFAVQAERIPDFPCIADELPAYFADIIDHDTLLDILIKARGNFREIVSFLAENKSSYAARLLTTLNDKDYSDCSRAILTAHLNHASSYAGRWSEDIYTKYVLAPRIYFEPMTDYREYLTGAFSEQQKAEFVACPERLWAYIETNISYEEEEGLANILATPAAVLRSGYGSLLSRKILFVAVLRSLGVPARLTPDVLHIEYYHQGGFIQVTKDEEKDALLLLMFGSGNWTYGYNWSISALRNGSFEYLDFSREILADNRILLSLPHGCYRVITSNRLPNGNTYSRQYDVVLDPQIRKELEITLRPIREQDMVSRAKINDFQVLVRDGGQMGPLTKLRTVMADGQNVLLWLAEDHEPSQHILNELMTLQDYFGNQVHLVFILGQQNAATNTLIAKAAAALNAEIVIDAEYASAELAARMTFVDPDKLPLVIVADKQLVTSYAISGYNVGTADMLLKILDMVR